MREHRIIPENITKFLVQDSDKNYIAYQCEVFAIYVDNVHSILKTGRTFQDPAIVIVKYEYNEQLIDFINGADKRLRPKRIFKTLRTKHIDKIDGFIKTCANNFCELHKNMRIRIICKEDIKLQNRFYKIFSEVNNEETNCSFDYDNYDTEFVIKKYQTNTVTYIVTWVVICE